MRVKKRDGRLQDFEARKIVRAALMAVHEVELTAPAAVKPDMNKLVHSVTNLIQAKVVNDIVSIEDIQNGVETALMHLDHTDAAKAYIIYRHERAKMRAVRRSPDKNAPADYIHIAKYARHLKELARREVYKETVNRVKEMHQRKFPQYHAEIETVFETYVHTKRLLPSMRSMQFGGLAIERDNARIFNCCYSLCDRLRVFQEALYLLLCGCGCGFSVQWKHVDKMPRLVYIDKKKVKHFVIPDTIVGWADALGALIFSYLSGECIEFSYHLIRAEGSPLETSGGLAPGHIPLRDGLEKIRKVLDGAQGRKLRPVECLDIFCFLAEMVLSGGIRRSSLIGLFSPEDTEMLYCKTKGVFRPAFGADPGINPQREMINISAAFLRSKVNRQQFERGMNVANDNYGCPGFYFLDDEDHGTNPCAEIGLHPTIHAGHVYSELELLRQEIKEDELLTGWAFCNLTEKNADAEETPDQFVESFAASAFIGTLQATYTDFPYLGPVSEAIAKRDALLGCSMTGMMDNPSVAFDPVIQQRCAALACKTNQEWAPRFGINPAARVTTIKPGGTAPWELGGVGSGCHPRHARRFFRRFTANPNEVPAQHFKKYNPHMVEVKPNGDWSLIFPIETNSESKTVKEMAALDFMEMVFSTYENFIKPGTVDNIISPGLTHNVSCTITVRDEERQDVINAVWANRHRIGAMSFAPLMLDKNFPYAPNEAVETEADEIKWNYLINNYVPVDWTTMHEEIGHNNFVQEPACTSGVCDRS